MSLALSLTGMAMTIIKIGIDIVTGIIIVRTNRVFNDIDIIIDRQGQDRNTKSAH